MCIEPEQVEGLKRIYGLNKAGVPEEYDKNVITKFDILMVSLFILGLIALILLIIYFLK